MMDPNSRDAQLRQAAFDHVNRLAVLGGSVLDSADLAAGFEFQGERIPLVNPQRGIFKPRQMVHLLSIRTVFPRQGGRVWYDDQREAHRQIYAGDDVVEYAFMGADPNSPDNRWLREAMQEQVPIIYFLGTSPGRSRRSFRPSSWVGIPSAYGSSLLSGRSQGHRLRQRRRLLPSADMRFVRSRPGCIRHRSGMPCSPPTEAAARSHISPSLGCSTPLTSSWMPTSSLGSRSSRTVSR